MPETAGTAATAAKAEARYIRISAQKARLVVDMIRGRKANDAVIVLRSVNKRIAPTVEKVLSSAIANLQNLNEDVDVDNLYVSEAYVNEGPRQKRIRPAPMGRAYRYVRRSAHIVVKVAEKA
jgi:large subunit ribosomal protein L22